MTLKELQVGKTATILSVGGNGALRQHFLDMEKQAFFMRRKQSIRYRRIRHLRLHWLEIRIVEKQRCSTS